MFKLYSKFCSFITVNVMEHSSEIWPKFSPIFFKYNVPVKFNVESSFVNSVSIVVDGMK